MISVELHKNTRQIADALIAVPYGGLITYDEMSEIIHRDIRRKRAIIYSAMKVAQRESGALWKRVTRVGYCRLTSDEIPDVGQTARVGIRKKAHRSQKSILAAISVVNDLKPEVHRRSLIEMGVLGTLEHLSRDRNLPTLSEKATLPPSAAETARQLLQSLGSKA